MSSVTRTRRLMRTLAQLIVVVIIIAIYAVLVTRGRIIGDLPW